MAELLTGLGLVLVIEGLALALAPSRIEQALEFLRALGPSGRRILGLIALATGTALLWALRAA
ncbi:DUF2065 family protein [Thioclava sp. BHET1]|nr:DUF2065 family protein [Thioclava sp. BHET1]